MFNENRQNENTDTNKAYSNTTYKDDDETDSTYAPSDRDSVGYHSASFDRKCKRTTHYTSKAPCIETKISEIYRIHL
jgi:hypothetical protein